MPDEKSIIKAFFRNYILFSSMDESILDDIVNAIKVLSLKPGDVLYYDEENSKDFYIAWSGRLRVTKQRGREREIANIIIGDFFGEDGVFYGKRLGSVQAVERSKVFLLDFSLMVDLFSRAPQLRKLLATTARSRKFAYDRHLKWLGGDEALYFIARKHPFFLSLYLFLPAIIFLISSAFLIQSLLAFEFSPISFWTSLFFCVFMSFWAIWLIVDWGNDYYAVTSRRVIWIEKVVAIYDSRQEAPLDTILTINRVSNPSLRMLIDYGTVIVKTYTGSILMRWSQNPDEMVFFIEGFKARARVLARQSDNQAMEKVIQQRLSGEVNPDRQKSVSKTAKIDRKPGKKDLLTIFSHSLKLRYEEGEQITYRKHWFILIRNTFLPGIVNLLLFIVAVYLYSKGYFVGVRAILVWLLIFFITIMWWLYRYVDWRNDIYVLTLEKIFDIERKPLTREEKKEAMLANILSLENTRVGIIGLILNFGTVTMNVGTDKLTFDYVSNPVQVQYEISDRMYAYRKRKEEEEIAKERERFADWLMTYHRQINPENDNENQTIEEGYSG